MFTIESIRKMTPVALQNSYLETPARGLMPRYVTQHIIDAMIGWQNMTKGIANKHLQKDVLSKLATLLNVAENNIALTTCTSHGFNLLANAMKWQIGDNVVISSCEHPNNFYPWVHLRRLGVEVRVIPSDNGIISPEIIKDYVDKNTRLIAASLVTFYPGAYLEIEKLANIAKVSGALLVIDAIQAVGFCPLEPEKMGISVLASAAYKGLMSPHGSGFMYVCPELLELLEPAELNMGTIVAIGEEQLNPVTEYNYIDSALKLQTMPSHLAGLAAMDAALDILLDINVKKINEHITKLARELAIGLNDIGIKTELPVDDKRLSHIVCAKRSDAEQMVRYARQQQLFFSNRRDGIRFGFHVYNNADDVSRTIDILKSYLNKI